jgi:hypothetical protein
VVEVREKAELQLFDELLRGDYSLAFDKNSPQLPPARITSPLD